MTPWSNSKLQHLCMYLYNIYPIISSQLLPYFFIDNHCCNNNYYALSVCRHPHRYKWWSCAEFHSPTPPSRYRNRYAIWPTGRSGILRHVSIIMSITSARRIRVVFQLIYCILRTIKPVCCFAVKLENHRRITNSRPPLDCLTPSDRTVPCWYNRTIYIYIERERPLRQTIFDNI